MAKIYYRYNPDTDNYERVYPSMWTRMIAVGRVLLLSTVIGVSLFLIAYYGMSKPSEQIVKEDNSALRSQLSSMDRRLTTALGVLDDIKKRDDNFYRVMMQIEPVSRTSRFAGLDNDRRYADMAKLPDAQMLTEMARGIDILERALYAQSVSFDKLRESLMSQTDKLAHIPSILPINIIDYTIASGFGNRIDPIYGTPAFHAGLDFPADIGDPVFATAKGTVVSSGWRDGYGNCIDISHGYGYLTRYGHLSKINVRQGQEVVRGDKIGEVGSTGKSTGPHLHYEVRLNDEPQNPVDYYFLDLTPEQYSAMIRQAEEAGHAMD